LLGSFGDHRAEEFKEVPKEEFYETVPRKADKYISKEVPRDGVARPKGEGYYQV